GGTGLAEMRRLLEAFADHGDYHRLREQALRENLLGKTSEHMVDAMLQAFRRRFLRAEDLPPAPVVALAMRAHMPEAAKAQILLPYYIRADSLVEECYRSLVLARLKVPAPVLTRDEVVEHLLKLGEGHPELLKWSAYLRLRWARGFLALLRQFGLMERHPRTSLRRLYLLLECFAFFWLWLCQKDGSFWDAERDKIWPLLQADGRQKEELLLQGQLRGWWHYQRAGDIVSFTPRYASVEEWLEGGLA
ncbi:MAG: DUF1819 family protein, partial [Clostridia bacterium]|nr:DUF1819 family protein [Clostridia bacterium]